ncbi:SRPBCC family protein [Paractinoplanes toevensis]|uniref:SRPBCC family protein n=1 Tax=Paractinoplanes toevensis TaxID=571911 RepID=UPI0027DCAB09|nr:SRPBCC family protein [Actinoplanes toevensis]
MKRAIKAPADRVFAVLSDGWCYSDWVVGTAHIRDVDPSWPAVGSQLHHKAGPWPVSLRDSSTVLAVTTDRRLKLKAGLWPLGEATVDIILEPDGPDATRVTMHEQLDGGPLLLLRNKINDLVLHARNTEALNRLADLAERR